MARVAYGRVREKVAEKKANEWYDARFPAMRTKLNLQGRAGWPDQCYWIPGGRPFLIEFKAEGEDPRALQSFIHQQLRDHGYDIEVHDKAPEAIAAIKRRIEEGTRRQAVEGWNAQGHDAGLSASTKEVIARGDRALARFKGAVDDLEKAVASAPARKPPRGRKF
jgi:hypothetical protein